MLRRLLKTLMMIIPLAGLLLYAYPALAAGIGVTPGKMEFKVRPGGIETQKLHVVNQSFESSQFRVYASGEYEEWFRIIPDEFILGPQETRSVQIVLAPPLTTAPGKFDFAVCVISVPSGHNLNIGAGIKVETQVQITRFPIMDLQWWIASAATLIIVVVVVIIVWWRRRRRYV